MIILIKQIKENDKIRFLNSQLKLEIDAEATPGFLLKVSKESSVKEATIYSRRCQIIQGNNYLDSEDHLCEI